MSTIAAARDLYGRGGRPNLFIKIPGTREGLPAIEEAIFAGVPVNVTLLFSRDQYLAAAEAFLRGGIANYIGTYWPVGDAAAATFAMRFYERLVAGQSIGAAIQAGRGAVKASGSIDWADYVHYGTQDFALKLTS